MNHKEQKTGRALPGFVNLGTTLMLAVLLVLTLTVLAMLDLSAARNDLLFSQTLADQETAYYTASNQSERILAEADARIRSQRFGGKPELSDLGICWQGDTICWQVPVDENRFLKAAYVPKTGTVTCWQVEPRNPRN